MIVNSIVMIHNSEINIFQYHDSFFICCKYCTIVVQSSVLERDAYSLTVVERDSY